MQIIIGSMMLWMSFTVQELMDTVCASAFHSPLFLFELMCCIIQATEHVIKLTFVFTTLVLIAATQGKPSAQQGSRHAIQSLLLP